MQDERDKRDALLARRTIECSGWSKGREREKEGERRRRRHRINVLLVLAYQ